MSFAELLWTDRRGAGRMESFPADSREDEDRILARLKTLRRPAELKFKGRVVGGVEDVSEGLGNPDDRRIRWNWWLERGFWSPGT
jgi:hypothetical protein